MDDFNYLATAINKTIDISLEIKQRIKLANRTNFSLSKHFKNKDLFRQISSVYKTLIPPVLLYDTKAWVLAQADEFLFWSC